MRSFSPFFVALLGWVACGDDATPSADGGRFDSSVADSGRVDSSTPDAGMDDAGALDAGGLDAGAMDAGEMCPDEVDDDDYTMAIDLGEIPDDAGYPHDSVEGDIFPITDQDWYSWHVLDEILGDVEPRAEVSGLPTGVPWEICVYFDCDSTTDGVDCGGDGTPDSLVAGEIEGCCAVSTEATVGISLAPSCSGIDDGGTVYVRVSRESGTASCEGYTMTWGDA